MLNLQLLGVPGREVLGGQVKYNFTLTFIYFFKIKYILLLSRTFVLNINQSILSCFNHKNVFYQCLLS